MMFLLVTINFMILLLTSSIVSHPLTNMPMSAEDADITSFFPTNTDHKFPIGGLITSLCHFSNEGLSNYNITAIMGSLNAPYDFKHHFQNYSYKSFNYIVKSGEEISLQYLFQLHAELEPIEYQLAITVFYQVDKLTYSTTYFNQTVELYFPTSEYDFETISLVVWSFVCTVIIALITIYSCFPDTTIPIVTNLFTMVGNFEKKNIRSLSTTVDPDDDWLNDQPKMKTK